LKERGVEFLEPVIIEGKAKVAQPEQVLKSVLDKFSESSIRRISSLSDKNILVTIGSTIEHIDPIRVITNLSSGKMGNAIAEQARSMGANVTVIYGHMVQRQLDPSDFNVIKVTTSEEMYNTVILELSSKKYDIAILAAAVTDFTLEDKKFTKKIDSRIGKLLLPLSTTKKIIDQVKHASKNDIFVVAFKAEHHVSDSYLIERGYEKLKECNGDLIIANDIGRKGSEVGSDNDEVFIIDRQKKVIHLRVQNKKNVARTLLHIIAESIDTKERNNNKFAK
jgi:phosphopantothenoylcysteine decarboxylase/phosphopantothenate--cysteine ligase